LPPLKGLRIDEMFFLDLVPARARYSKLCISVSLDTVRSNANSSSSGPPTTGQHTGGERRGRQRERKATKEREGGRERESAS